MKGVRDTSLSCVPWGWRCTLRNWDNICSTPFRCHPCDCVVPNRTHHATMTRDPMRLYSTTSAFLDGWWWTLYQSWPPPHGRSNISKEFACIIPHDIDNLFFRHVCQSTDQVWAYFIPSTSRDLDSKSFRKFPHLCHRDIHDVLFSKISILENRA